ncbi:hypothetical protein LX32DRAFT_218450 [Colletotrichum zoysiae]|uniref:Uncharacterized protein n=1 Tax=Colletotrichum zoysiae TaxID=1216348 RepID=A0AAD9HQ67_9PEZI|nr:hypothetical protein LX32DRAFT_218450 [Colletotrichum zoysiae]
MQNARLLSAQMYICIRGHRQATMYLNRRSGARQTGTPPRVYIWPAVAAQTRASCLQRIMPVTITSGGSSSFSRKQHQPTSEPQYVSNTVTAVLWMRRKTYESSRLTLFHALEPLLIALSHSWRTSFPPCSAIHVYHRTWVSSATDSGAIKVYSKQT